MIFGKQWTDSGPVAATLYLIGPVLTLQVFSGALLNAAGHPEITCASDWSRPPSTSSGFFIAVLYFKDIVAVAAAFVIGSYLLLPLNLYLQHRYAGISIIEHLWQLRWIALCTAIMAAAVIAVKAAVASQVHQEWALLAIQVVVGVLAYVVAMLIFERALVREVFTFGFQAIPGGDRIARAAGIDRGGKGAGGKGGKGGRRRNRIIEMEAEAARGEARKVDMGMDIAADLGDHEARTADI